MRAIAVQLTPGNGQFQLEAKAACHARGIAYLVWERTDQVPYPQTAEALRWLQPDGYLADVEGPMLDPSFPGRLASEFPGIPRSLCATGALDQSYPGRPAEASAPWIAAGFDLAMQDYWHVNSRAAPDNAENFAYWRGWPVRNPAGQRHVPVIEINAEGAGNLADALPTVRPWLPTLGIYLAEFLRDEDWATLATF